MTIKFGTDGWRAVIADEFTFANAEIVTRAIAQYVIGRFGTSKPVVIGYDLRFLADKFAMRSAEILTEYGLKVEMTDQWYPTPVVAYVAKYHDTAGAMMFTASHNPPEYLGIKFIPEYAGPAMPDITDVIVANVAKIEADITAGKTGVAREVTASDIQKITPRKEYCDAIEKLVDISKIKSAASQRPLKVLFDPMYGCAQTYTDKLLQDLGHTVEGIHNSHNPSFGGRMPEPIGKLLPELLSRVPAEKFDFGIASDGDGDRFGVVDNNGRFLGANEIIPMVFRHLYKNKGLKGNVVKSLATSNLLDALAEKYGDVEVISTPIGFKWMGQVMREQDIIIGGEQSGGFSIQGHIPEKDGILAALVITEMLCYEQKSMSQIYDDMMAEAGIVFYNHEENFHVPDSQKKAIVDYLKQLKVGDNLAGKTIEKLDTRDGIKLIFSKYEWLCVRPSGTEPVLRTYMESTDDAVTKALRQSVQDMVNGKMPVAA